MDLLKQSKPPLFDVFSYNKNSIHLKLIYNSFHFKCIRKYSVYIVNSSLLLSVIRRVLYNLLILYVG